MRCTGQKPNSQLMRDFLPETINDHGFVKVRPTLQIDASDVSPKRFSEKLNRIYPIGDVSRLFRLRDHLVCTDATSTLSGRGRGSDQGGTYWMESSWSHRPEHHV